MLSGRSFDPRRPPDTGAPSVDYSLARRSVLARVRSGTLGTTDVCDAHPELMRAATNIGAEDERPCPICSHHSLKRVSYVYGDELRHNSGKVVYPAGWLDDLARQHDQFTCYIVEVCVDCSWNHLLRSYLTGRKWATLGRAPAARSPSAVEGSKGSD